MLRAVGGSYLLMQPAMPVQPSVDLMIVPSMRSAQARALDKDTKSACPENLGFENVHGVH